jgi:YfiH family protein
VGLEAADLVFMEQVHGPAVAVVGLSDAGRGLTDHARAVPGVDALVTTDPDVGLVVMVADCVPVLLAVAGRGVAAVHAGRAGVTAGVVGAAVAILAAEAGAEPRAVLAVIGPAVGPCCYEVPADLRREVVVAAPAAGGTTSWGTPSLDLPAAVVQQLVAAGAGAVRDIGGCTRCDTTWFSHRATTAPPPGERPAPAGRQAGVIRMGAPPALLTDVHSLGFPV